MRDLREDPRAVFDLGMRRSPVGGVHQLDGALVIAEQLAEVGGARQTRHVARPHVEHPLRRLLGLGVAAELRVAVDEEPVHEHVIRHRAVDLLRGVDGPLELVLPEQDPDLELSGLQVARLDLQRALGGCPRLPVERGIGRFPGAPGQPEREIVPQARPLRVLLERRAGGGDATLGRRAGFGCLHGGGEAGRLGRRRHGCARGRRRRLARVRSIGTSGQDERAGREDRGNEKRRVATPEGAGPRRRPLGNVRLIYGHGAPAPAVQPGSVGSMCRRSRPLGEYAT